MFKKKKYTRFFFASPSFSANNRQNSTIFVEINISLKKKKTEHQKLNYKITKRKCKKIILWKIKKTM